MSQIILDKCRHPPPDNIFGIRVGRHLQFEAATVVVGAERPEVGLLEYLYVVVGIHTRIG